MLIYGPFFPEMRLSMVLRISSIFIPSIVIWLLLFFVPLSVKLDQIFKRILSILLIIFLLYHGLHSIFVNHHFVNNEVIQTREGFESVGEFKIVIGPDWGSVIMYFIIALFVGVFEFSSGNERIN
jgi:hypothetical protein